MGLNKDLDNKMLSSAASGSERATRDALNAGADPAARDGQGSTGMHLAVRKQDLSWDSGRELVAMFLNRGLDINTKDLSGATVLHFMTTDGSYGVSGKMADLVTFGADIEARDGIGQTPLHWAAAKQRRSDSVKFLIERGADVNARNEAGETPLHAAAKRGEEGVIRMLLNAGADIHAKTRAGKTVWDYAVDGGQDYQAQSLKAEAAERIRRAELQRREDARKQEEERARRAAEKPADPWSLLGPQKVAHAATEKQIGYRITEVFNFAARTYTQITHNLSTKSEAVAFKTFDEFDDKSGLERAFEALERLGGKSDRAVINGPLVEKPRKGLKLPQAGGG